MLSGIKWPSAMSSVARRQLAVGRMLKYISSQSAGLPRVIGQSRSIGSRPIESTKRPGVCRPLVGYRSIPSVATYRTKTAPVENKSPDALAIKDGEGATAAPKRRGRPRKVKTEAELALEAEKQARREERARKKAMRETPEVEPKGKKAAKVGSSVVDEKVDENIEKPVKKTRTRRTKKAQESVALGADETVDEQTNQDGGELLKKTRRPRKSTIIRKATAKALKDTEDSAIEIEEEADLEAEAKSEADAEADAYLTEAKFNTAKSLSVPPLLLAHNIPPPPTERPRRRTASPSSPPKQPKPAKAISKRDLILEPWLQAAGAARKNKPDLSKYVVPEIKKRLLQQHESTTPHQIPTDDPYEPPGDVKDRSDELQQAGFAIEVTARHDVTRVNIVSQKLVDDVLDYLHSGHPEEDSATASPGGRLDSSLDRHRGCDLIDLYPGTGLWSKALHDRLQPRSHILMEPDYDYYAPSLASLTSRDGVRVLRQSGIVWTDLNAVLDSLEHQQANLATDHTQEPKRNDTLLVTANLSFHPKRSFGKFDSISQLVLYQLISSVRYHALFQRYGLVRMLLWMKHEDNRAWLPSSAYNRRKGTIEAEFSCNYVHQVAGIDRVTPAYATGLLGQRTNQRYYGYDIVGTHFVRERMARAGITMPTDRRTSLFRQLDAMPVEKLLARDGHRFYDLMQEDLYMACYERRQISEEYFLKKMKILEARKDYIERTQAYIDRFITLLERTRQLQQECMTKDENSSRLAFLDTPEYARIMEATHRWSDAVDKLPRSDLSQARILRDNHILFSRVKRNLPLTPSPSVPWNEGVSIAQNDYLRLLLERGEEHHDPILLWDRRQYEPLVVRPHEFVPHVGCDLYDIQPKAMNPLIRHTSSSSATHDYSAKESIGVDKSNNTVSRNVFDILLSCIMTTWTTPLPRCLDSSWPGAADGLLPKCPTLLDPSYGIISSDVKHSTVVGRTIHEDQVIELLQAWLNWPFRPQLTQLLGRHLEDFQTLSDLNGRSM